MSRDKRKPDWLKSNIPTGEEFFRIRRILNKKRLHTVCEEAACPNTAECWNRKHFTFIILGQHCTRGCRFCNVTKSKPLPPDPEEPERVSTLIKELKARYAVITSVTRDDLPDGGAQHWARAIEVIKKENPGTLIEALIPDFGGDLDALKLVVSKRPDVVAHNLETVKRLYSRVRAGADYKRSLGVLERLKEMGCVTKTGIMVGLGETREDLKGLFKDVKRVGVKILTIGQYLRPTRKHIEVNRYLNPEEFEELKDMALEIGIEKVDSGPLVRSSYKADQISGFC